MGEVYRARDARLLREVAIKVLPTDVAASRERVLRFEREARAVAALSHPNIVSVYDMGTSDETSYVVLELLEGETLRERLNAGPFPWRRAVEIAAGIADGLAAAHAQAIIHRDIKPENLFLTRDGVVKILDFGLARAVDTASGEIASIDANTATNVTRTGTMLGTVGYISPEQAQGRALDARSDIFSFGCVLHEMLTGQRAFGGDVPAEVLASILRDPPRELARADAPLPPELERLVLHCLEKRPLDRFQSARDLAFQLRSLAIASGSGSVEPGEPEGSIRSLAVLPLRNLAGDPDQDFFADGMTEALIADLSGIDGVRVISRSAAMQYKGVNRPLREIARELGVDAVVEGSVLRSGERVRITAELVNCATDSNLWAQSYDRDQKDILSLQCEVASAIVGGIEGKLNPQTQARLSSSRQVDPKALEAYLKGRYYWNRRTEETLRRGIEFFNQAIDVDPTYAPAHAGLADSYNILGFYYHLPPRDAFPRAKAAAERALQMDDTLTEVHALVGYARLYFDWAGRACEDDFKRTLAANPNAAEGYRYYANYLTAVGRVDEALVAVKQACRLDPLSLINSGALAWVHYFRREYEAALRQIGNTLEMDRTFALAHLYRAWSLQMTERHDEALAALECARQYGGRVPLIDGHLAYGHALAGNVDDARQALDDLREQSKEHYVSAYLLALVHIGLGDTDGAFENLDRAVDERAHFLVFLDSEPKMDPLRPDPRFEVLRSRMESRRAGE
jgi:TolB-like protein/lipoprotein NlpI